MGISLNFSVFASVLYVAKLGNYQYPRNIFFWLDYKMFLYLNSFKINYYNITRIMNIGLAVFLLMNPLFVYQFTRSYYHKFTIKHAFKLMLLAVLPAFYIFFYDPQTSFNIYIMMHSVQNDFSKEQLIKLVKSIDIFNYIWILAYLFLPIDWLIKYYQSTTVMLKKKQIISLSVCLLILNLFCMFMFIFGPFKQMYVYSFSQNLLNFPQTIAIPFYYYDTVPIVLLIVMQAMLYIIVKYKGLDTVNLFQDYMIQRNVKGLNKNLRSIFHSFKNTLFTIKILAMQAETGMGGIEGMNAIKRIQEVTEFSLDSMTRMLNSFNEIKINTVRCRVIDIVENALKRVEFSENITIKKKYIFPNVEANIDEYHMTEVLINLLHNACDAINSAKRKQGIIQVEISAEHEWAIIKVTDNGTGISKKDQRNIFKPFVTSKSRQNNWGVGLSYAFRVVRAHLGFITVDSIENEYTTFQILLFRAGGYEEI